MGTRQETARPWIVLPAILALAYALAVVGAAWRAPDKGFLAFTEHRVVHIDDGGPASRAGLAIGDVITHVDGAPIASTFDCSDRVLTRRPGDTVAFSSPPSAPPAATNRQQPAPSVCPAPRSSTSSAATAWAAEG